MSTNFRFEAAPLILSGQRIKAGFHCHTMKSDGGLSPGETVKRYRSKKFQCLAITDHALVTSMKSFSCDGFIGIDSTENGGDPDIIAVGIRSPVPCDLSLRERAAELAAQGGFIIGAHPTWCGALPDAYADCHDLMAIEIYNAYCDVAYGNGFATELWDMLLGQGKRVWGVASDDAHLNPKMLHSSETGLGWVEIWSGDSTQDSVVTALKQGRFFSTQGPAFNSIAVENSTIRLECSPVQQIRWRTFGNAGFVEYAPEGSPITSSALPAGYVPTRYTRIELVDSHGKRAWSNPFFAETTKQA